MFGRILCVAVLPLSLTLGAGIRPRATAADYPAHESAGGVTVAAAVIPPDQVKKLFAANLNKMGYVVVEVAVYPDDGNEVDLRSRDFLLRSGSGSTVRPVSVDVITSRMEQKNAPKAPPLPSNVQVYTGTTIGYESGGYDPVTGRRGGGVYTGTSVGVGIGNYPAPPPPNPSGPDPISAGPDLASQALPETKTIQPVAGYLYFPKPEGWKEKSAQHLTYYGEHGQVRLEIPAPKK
jgi:hypothetical protein